MCFTFYEEYGLEQEWQVLDIRAVEMIDAAKAQIHGREEGGGAEADECPGAVSLYKCLSKNIFTYTAVCPDVLCWGSRT
jgi:hypothetical protein